MDISNSRVKVKIIFFYIQMGSESILIHFICVLMTKTLNSFLGSALPCWKPMLKYDIAN